MSDSVDLRLLGKMVTRLQSTVEDVRQEYAGIRASLDALSASVHQRFAEFGVRMSGFELGQMKLAASVDEAHTKIDRIETDIEELSDRQAAQKDRLQGVETRLEGMETRLGGMEIRLGGMDSKLDLILSRLSAG